MNNIPIVFFFATLLTIDILPLFAQKFLKRDDANEMKSLNYTDKKIWVAMASHSFLLETRYYLGKTDVRLDGGLPYYSELYVYPDLIKTWYEVQSATPRIFYDAAIPGKRRIEMLISQNFEKGKARMDNSIAVKRHA